MATSKYYAVVTNMLKIDPALIVPDQAVLAVWNNETHFDEWAALQNTTTTDSIKLLRMSISVLPFLKQTKESSTIVGVVYCTRDDLKDARLMYTMEVAKK